MRAPVPTMPSPAATTAPGLLSGEYVRDGEVWDEHGPTGVMGTPAELDRLRATWRPPAGVLGMLASVTRAAASLHTAAAPLLDRLARTARWAQRVGGPWSAREAVAAAAPGARRWLLRQSEGRVGPLLRHLVAAARRGRAALARALAAGRRLLRAGGSRAGRLLRAGLRALARRRSPRTLGPPCSRAGFPAGGRPRAVLPAGAQWRRGRGPAMPRPPTARGVMAG